MSQPNEPLRVRPIRVAPGVRERVIAEMSSRPESRYAVESRMARDHVDGECDCDVSCTVVGCNPTCSCYPRDRACIHPGLFSMHVPGDPVRFNPSEHCWQCDRDIPASEL